MNLEKILVNSLPLGLYKFLREKHRHPTFGDLYKQFLETEADSFSSESSKFRNIISIQGLGYSGSGAIMDSLREYDNVKILADTDKEGSKSAVKSGFDEIHLLKQAGGLFEIERFLDCDNTFLNDALLGRFIKMTERSDIYRKIPASRQFYFAFLRSITDGVIFNKRIYYNNYLYNYNLDHGSPLSYLKKMSVCDYRRICKQFLINITNLLYSKGVDFLVLDQLLQDDEYDMNKYLDYIPNLKLIVSFRDPRDVYAYGVEKDIEWIHHHGDVEMFIRFYKNCRLKNLDISSSSGYLVLRFEECVTDYDSQMARIVEYLGLDETHHVAHRTFFDPDISKNGIGIWRKSPLSKDVFSRIYEELHEYCWEAHN